MDFLHREIKLPFRLSVVLPAILSYFVVLVFTGFCLVQITEGATKYQELRQEGWWPNCPTSKLEDSELSLHPDDPRSVCLDKRSKADFFFTEGTTAFLLFLVLFILLQLFSKWERTSAIIIDPRFTFFNWIAIILIYLIATSLLGSQKLASVIWRFGGSCSVVSFYQLLGHPQIRKIWWWVTIVFTLLLYLIFILTSLLNTLAKTIIPIQY